MQTRERRRYWAMQRRPRLKKAVTVTHEKPVITPPSERALVASSEQEYAKLTRDYPNKRIILDVHYAQQSLFNTLDLIDV